MDHNSNRNKYSFFKYLLQATSLLMIVIGFLLWQSYKMMYRNAQDESQHLSIENVKQKEIIRIAISTIRDQKNSYI